MKTRRLFHLDYLVMTVMAFLLLALLSVGVRGISFLNPVGEALDRFSVVDLYFQILHSRHNEKVSDDIVIVDISRLHSRADIASTIDSLADCNPECIGVDCIFEGEKDDIVGNSKLLEVAARLKERVVFANKLIADSSGVFASSVGSFFVTGENYIEGYTNLTNNLDNTPIRTLSLSRELQGRKMLSFPHAIADLYAGRVLEFGDKDLTINYSNIRFPVIQPGEIAAHKSEMVGKIVLVGGLYEEQDMHATPLQKKSGLEIQAYSIATLLRGELKHSPKWLNFVLAFVLCYCFLVRVESKAKRHRERAERMKKKGPFAMYLVSLQTSPTGLTYTVWSLIICFILYFLFVSANYCIEGAMIFAILALALKARSWYRPTILAMKEKGYKMWLVRNTVFEDNKQNKVELKASKQ